MPRPTRRPLLLLLLLLGATLLARLWLIRQGSFDGLYGQDPYAYHNYAVGPLRDSLLALAPPPPFHWPPGYPYLVALASFLVGVTPRPGSSSASWPACSSPSSPTAWPGKCGAAPARIAGPPCWPPCW